MLDQQGLDERGARLGGRRRRCRCSAATATRASSRVERDVPRRAHHAHLRGHQRDQPDAHSDPAAEAVAATPSRAGAPSSRRGRRLASAAAESGRLPPSATSSAARRRLAVGLLGQASSTLRRRAQGRAGSAGADRRRRSSRSTRSRAASRARRRWPHAATAARALAADAARVYTNDAADRDRGGVETGRRGADQRAAATRRSAAGVQRARPRHAGVDAIAARRRIADAVIDAGKHPF